MDANAKFVEKRQVEVENIKSIRESIYLVNKRIIDIIVSLIGIIILIPMTIIIGIARELNNEKGKIIFDQLRIGKDGKKFKLYKYRSMVMNADYKLEKYLEKNEEARLEYKTTKKLKNDPRITKVGAFIRKTSLDEFPQFVNVLKGEMSIVGPRPYLLREKEEMGEAYETIIKMKPGLTGYWQTNGRSNVTFKDRLEMDVQYYKDRSCKTDCKLFLKTFSHLVKNEGAM